MNPNQIQKRLPPVLLAITFCLVSFPTQALPTDKDQVIKISAKSAFFDQKQGLATYTGAVKLSQGSLEISADKITVLLGKDQKPETAIAEGNPAYYQLQPDADKAVIHAEANIVRYAVSKDYITLEKNAFVEQNGATTRGGKIDYDMANGTVSASGAGNESGRVEFVIPPQTNKKD